MESKTKKVETDIEFKVLTDPYRMKILDVFIEQQKPLTVKMVADRLEETPAKVFYHVKKLIDIDMLKLDHIQVINGINAKYYKLMYNEISFDILDESSKIKKDFKIDEITKLVLKNIDAFRDEVLNKRDRTKTKEITKEDSFFISVKNLYLTEEEYKEFKDFTSKFVSKHSKIDDTKKKFLVISGLIDKG